MTAPHPLQGGNRSECVTIECISSAITVMHAYTRMHEASIRCSSAHACVLSGVRLRHACMHMRPHAYKLCTLTCMAALVSTSVAAVFAFLVYAGWSAMRSRSAGSLAVRSAKSVRARRWILSEGCSARRNKAYMMT